VFVTGISASLSMEFYENALAYSAEECYKTLFAQHFTFGINKLVSNVEYAMRIILSYECVEQTR